MMKTNVMIWMGVALATVTMAQEPKVEPEVVLKARVDRADALYEVGETVTFRIEGKLGGKAAEGVVVECVISKDGVEARAVEQVTLKAGKAEVTGSLKEPGFLQMRARSGKASVLAAAGFEPLKLKPSLPVPEDFDSFWKGQKALLAAVTVGFVDATCPPTSVYAAFNALTVPKKMHVDVLAGHTNTPGAVTFMQAAALEHVRVMRGL